VQTRIPEEKREGETEMTGGISLFDRITTKSIDKEVIVLKVAVVVCVTVLCAAPVGADEGEYWLRLDLKKELGESTLSLCVERRAAGELGEDYYRSVGVGIGRLALRHLELGGSYLCVRQGGGDDWTTEHRPLADAVIRWGMFGMSVSDRSRLELRLRDGEEALRYRNRLKASRSLVRGALAVSADEEIFVDMERSEFNRNRLGCGLESALGGVARVGLFYMLESRKSRDAWSHSHIAGLSLGFSL
jgi:hypothetical protein